MSDATPDNSAAVIAGVEQGLAAAAPAVALAAASADPRLQAVLVAAQALQPAIVQLESLRDIGLMTQPQVDLAVEQMKGNMVTVHNAFLAALASHPVA